MADTKISALNSATSTGPGDYFIVNRSDGQNGFDTEKLSWTKLTQRLNDDFVTIAGDEMITGKKQFSSTVRIRANAGSDVPAALTIGDDANNGGYGFQVTLPRDSNGNLITSDPGSVFRLVSLDITSPITINNLPLIDINKPYLHDTLRVTNIRSTNRVRVGPQVTEVDLYSQLRLVSVNRDPDTGNLVYGGTSDEPAISWGWIPGTALNDIEGDLDSDEGYGWGVSAESASGFNRGGTKFTLNFLKNYHKKFTTPNQPNDPNLRQNGKTLIDIVPPNDGGLVDGAVGAKYTLSWSRDLVRVQSSSFTTRSSSTHTITDVNVDDFGSKLDSITPVLATDNDSLKESLDFIGSELSGVDSKFAIESVDEEGNVSYGINYDAITIGLVAALKSEKAKRVSLETQVADLLARVTALES